VRIEELMKERENSNKIGIRTRELETENKRVRKIEDTVIWGVKEIGVLMSKEEGRKGAEKEAAVEIQAEASIATDILNAGFQNEFNESH
jgi:hypothetical protein